MSAPLLVHLIELYCYGIIARRCNVFRFTSFTMLYASSKSRDSRYLNAQTFQLASISRLRNLDFRYHRHRAFAQFSQLSLKIPNPKRSMKQLAADYSRARMGMKRKAFGSTSENFTRRKSTPFLGKENSRSVTINPRTMMAGNAILRKNYLKFVTWNSTKFEI